MNQIKIALVSGFEHILSLENGLPDFERHSDSVTTQNALAAAYAADNWAEYIEPEPIALPPDADWDSFTMAMMQNTDFATVYAASKTSPYFMAADGLATALLQVEQGKLNMFSNCLNLVCTGGGATPAMRDSWANLAGANNLPSDFVEVLRGG